MKRKSLIVAVCWGVRDVGVVLEMSNHGGIVQGTKLKTSGVVEDGEGRAKLSLTWLTSEWIYTTGIDY